MPWNKTAIVIASCVMLTLLAVMPLVRARVRKEDCKTGAEYWGHLWFILAWSGLMFAVFFGVIALMLTFGFGPRIVGSSIFWVFLLFCVGIAGLIDTDLASKYFTFVALGLITVMTIAFFQSKSSHDPALAGNGRDVELKGKPGEEVTYRLKLDKNMNTVHTTIDLSGASSKQVVDFKTPLIQPNGGGPERQPVSITALAYNDPKNPDAPWRGVEFSEDWDISYPGSIKVWIRVNGTHLIYKDGTKKLNLRNLVGVPVKKVEWLSATGENQTFTVYFTR